MVFSLNLTLLLKVVLYIEQLNIIVVNFRKVKYNYKLKKWHLIINIMFLWLFVFIIKFVLGIF